MIEWKEERGGGTKAMLGVPEVPIERRRYTITSFALVHVKDGLYQIRSLNSGRVVRESPSLYTLDECFRIVDLILLDSKSLYEE